MVRQKKLKAWVRVLMGWGWRREGGRKGGGLQEVDKESESGGGENMTN